MARFLILFGFLLGALALRYIWWTQPSLVWCVLFWIFLFVAFGLGRNIFVMPGAASNAAATIANGGYMPSSLSVPHEGIYIQLTEHSALPLLCDIFWGSSVGDGLIILGVIIFIAAELRRLNARKHNISVQAET